MTQLSETLPNMDAIAQLLNLELARIICCQGPRWERTYWIGTGRARVTSLLSPKERAVAVLCFHFTIAIAMVPLNLLLLTIASLQTCSALSRPSLPGPIRNSLAKLNYHHQAPIMNIPNILVPPSNKDNDDGSSGGSDGLSISDVIGKERIISIFAGFTRDVDSISKRLDDNSKNTTVLAPLNSALQRLPRKPWEDPEDYDQLGAKAYEGESGEDRAQRNLRRFTEAHVVPASPWKEGEKTKTMGGGEIWWEEKDGAKVVCIITYQGRIS